MSLRLEYGSQDVSGKSHHFTSNVYRDSGVLPRVSPAGLCPTIVSTTYSFMSCAAILVNSGNRLSSSNQEVL